MSLSLISEVWEVLCDHIDLNDRAEAADALVTYLMENNYEVDDIKDAFSDKIITKALKGYAEENFVEDEYDEDEYEEDDYNDNDNDWD